MKTVFLVCVCACLAAAVVSAAPKEQKQPARPGAGPAGRVIERLDEVVAGLDLSADQKTQVDAILADLPGQMRELAQQTQDMERRDRAQRFAELLRDTRNKIEAELNDAQRAQFADATDEFRRETEENRAARQNQPVAPADNAAPGKGKSDNAQAAERRQRGQQGAPMVQRLQKALSSVDLTEEQKPQVEQAMSSLRDKVTQIRADAQADPEAARTAAREALAETRRELGQILTQEQRQQLRQAMQADDAERPRRGAPRDDTANPTPPAEMSPGEGSPGDGPPATRPG